MSDPNVAGGVTWRDLTVENADEVRDFYKGVVGWDADALSMGDYSDYCMKNAAGEVVAGVCHARGSNAKIPPQWLIYITVESVEKSVEAALASGGKIIDGPRNLGKQAFAVVQDPAGAVFAVIESAPSSE